MKQSIKQGQARKLGFTLVEIMIVVAIIGLLAAIAIPNFVHARTASQQNACINNLRQLDGAAEQWGIENKIATTSTALSASPLVLQPYLGRGSAGSLPVCPSDPRALFITSYIFPSGNGAAQLPGGVTVNFDPTTPECQINGIQNGSKTHYLQ